MRDILHFNDDALNRASDLRIVYSAMHGVGHDFAKRAFATFNLPAFVSVAAQEAPDPLFTTLASPNPENKACFDRAVEVAETHWGHDGGEGGLHALVLANDPDADRLAGTGRKGRREGEGRKVEDGPTD
jgi:phosphomannomutase